MKSDVCRISRTSGQVSEKVVFETGTVSCHCDRIKIEGEILTLFDHLSGSDPHGHRNLP